MKKFPEQFTDSQGERPESEQEKRVLHISRFIETRVIGKHESLSKDEEREIQEYYTKLSPREKADILYNKLMAYMVDRQAERARVKEAKEHGEKIEPEKPDPYFISEVKILFNDPAVKELIPETYGEARVDAKKTRVSELGNLWRNINKEIKEKEVVYKELERKLHVSQISGKTAISSAKSRMERLADNLSRLEKRKKEIETLEGFPAIVENTDGVANFQYENLKEYKKQLDSGFVWLPSRKEIHQKTVGSILNHRWLVLIGEAGSGKSDQADAAALELTGYLPTHIACSNKTGEVDLIKDVAIDKETGGSYNKHGALLEAFSGKKDSRQKKPEIPTGRLARLDEAYRIPHESSGYSILKEARQVKSGDLFYGEEVLPGSGAIWTTNPPGPRYPGRTTPDAAMRRELAEIKVDYPEMSIENPELYEFALVALMDENNHIAAAKEELAPAYERKEIPENQRKVLEDGSVVIAKNEIVRDMSDRRHGALWRFSGAIKSLQDSFVYGNAEMEKYPDSLLRFKEDADGNIEITADGSGEPLTLSTSTVTLGELASWMMGFNERRQKQDKEFRVDTLTEWLNFKINTYLEQADKSDKEKLRAIFSHFGFLDKVVIPNISGTKPLIPKEIGYLSPRVPRPVYVERPVGAEAAETEAPQPKTKEVKEYETRQMLLEDGSRVLVRIQEFTLPGGVFDLTSKQLVPAEIAVEEKFRIKGESFTFAGIIEDAGSPFNSQPIGQLAGGEKLYRIFTPENLNIGIMEEFKNSFENDLENMEKGIEDFCAIESEESKPKKKK